MATLDRALRAAGSQLLLHSGPSRATGVDESLIRQQLARSPAERLEGLEAMYEEAAVLAEAPRVPT